MKDKKGFTLVELIATIVILGIVTTIGAISYSSIQRKAKLKQTMNDFSDALSGAMASYQNNEITSEDIAIRNIVITKEDNETFENLKISFCKKNQRTYSCINYSENEDDIKKLLYDDEDSINEFKAKFDCNSICDNKQPSGGGGEGTGPDTINISGEITWVDSNNKYNKRPNTVNVSLYKNGYLVASKPVSSADNWKYTFTGLPDEGNSYEVKQDSINNYSTSYNGYIITNAYVLKGTCSVTLITSSITGPNLVHTIDFNYLDTYLFKFSDHFDNDELFGWSLIEGDYSNYLAPDAEINLTDENCNNPTYYVLKKKQEKELKFLFSYSPTIPGITLGGLSIKKSLGSMGNVDPDFSFDQLDDYNYICLYGLEYSSSPSGLNASFYNIGFSNSDSTNVYVNRISDLNLLECKKGNPNVFESPTRNTKLILKYNDNNCLDPRLYSSSSCPINTKATTVKSGLTLSTMCCFVNPKYNFTLYVKLFN